MSAVSDAVLNWLSSVLRNEYHDISRTYNDTAQVLAQYPSIRPRTEVYSTLITRTWKRIELGSWQDSLAEMRPQLTKMTYHFPVAIWVPHAYPREAPLVFVTPTEGMLVRPGQHVSSDGRVYHPYLAKWADFWQRSSVLDLVALLREVFGREPPVIARQQVQQAPAGIVNSPAPPPRPPPPHQQPQLQQGWRDGAQITPTPQEYGRNGPPPLPPKGQEGSGNGRPRSPGRGPPLPPLPSQQSSKHPLRQQYIQAGPQHSKSYPYQGGNPLSVATRYGGYELPPHMRPHEMADSPISPVTPVANLTQQQYTSLPPEQQQTALPLQQYAPPDHHQQQPPLSQIYTQQQHQHPQQQPQLPQPAPPQAKLPQPQLDLLSDPLDVQLPSQSGTSEPLPLPPVPPNPEKDALLHALSQSLVSQATQTITHNISALQSLSAQHQALLLSQTTLQNEFAALAHLNSLLTSNERVLHTAMAEINASIAAAAQRRRPEIDDVLVCPTVLGQQIWNLTAEEKACVEARIALGRALDRGRVGIKPFVTQMRAVGREEFFKKALGRKAAGGMGLDVDGFAAGR